MELLERDTYLHELDTALADAAAGEGRVVLVSGEAGIGKTTLIENFTRHQTRHARILWGACDALFTPRPLGPLHDMAAQIQGELASLMNAKADQAAIFSACLQLLQSQPAVIVFEDIHWADEASLDLLKYLGRRIQRTQALLIATYRDDELSLQHPLRLLLGDLATSASTQRIRLTPLSMAAVRLLADSALVDAAVLHRQTGGNPFFVTEVLATEKEGVPPTVRDAVLARAARLSLSGRAALNAAAVIGTRIEPWLLAEVTRAEAGAIDESLSLGILRPQGEMLAFRHELGRQAILNAIPPHQRVFLHQVVLDALQASPLTQNDMTRLAHHAEAAGDREAILSYAPAAARQAAQAGAHRESAALYALALRFADQMQPDEHALILQTYSIECNLTEGQPKAIIALQEALDIWKELQEPLKQGEVLATLAIHLRNNGNNAEAERASRAAIELLETLPPSRELALAYRVQTVLRLANRDIAAAIEWGEKAIALAQRFGDFSVQAMAQVAVGSARLFLDYERGCAYLERLLEVARETGQETHIANTYAYLGACSVELHQFHRAEQYLAEGIDYVSDRVLDIFHHFMFAWQALTSLYLGHWHEAARVTAKLLESPTGSAVRKIPTLVTLGRLYARRGDTDAHKVLEEALRLATQTGTLQHLGWVRAARAEAAWLAGDSKHTAEEARAVYDLAVSRQHPWFTGELAFWRWCAGDEVVLPEWAAEPFALQINGDWRGAATAWETLGCPYERARALADGDSEAQIAALAVFEQLGARPMIEITRQKLRAAGIQAIPHGPRAATRENPFGLTNRQVDVLTLLIENLTNAEIAARLHISPKTAGHHVSAVLAKLDVSSREEAADLARQHPHFNPQE